MKIIATQHQNIETVDTYLIAANQVVLRKIKDYCRYQPRTHQQVRQKLYGWTLAKNTVETLLAALIEEGLVNESRFAVSYAGDRVRVNRWGRNKVRMELWKRQISSYCIKEAIATVDPVHYEKEMRRLAAKKWASFQGKGLHPGVRAKRTANFLIGKGYEPNVVWKLIGELKNPKTPNDDS